jgi:dihydroneopterin aldolase
VPLSTQWHRKLRRGCEVADRVSGHGFRYEVQVGFGAEERATPQTIRVDFEVRTNWRQSAIDDHAHEIVDYAEVDREIHALLTNKEWRLIEAIAEAVAKRICTAFPVDQVQVTITKQPADMAHCDGVSVSCSRTPADYFSA